jgi:hypothetical protein
MMMMMMMMMYATRLICTSQSVFCLKYETHKINYTLRIKIYALLAIFPDQPLPNVLLDDTEENR